jgi:hypothetical protein
MHDLPQILKPNTPPQKQDPVRHLSHLQYRWSAICNSFFYNILLKNKSLVFSIRLPFFRCFYFSASYKNVFDFIFKLLAFTTTLLNSFTKCEVPEYKRLITTKLLYTWKLNSIWSDLKFYRIQFLTFLIFFYRLKLYLLFCWIKSITITI